jgi:hypothetical protein
MAGGILAVGLEVIRTLFSLRLSLVAVVADHAVSSANEGVIGFHAAPVPSTDRPPS